MKNFPGKDIVEQIKIRKKSLQKYLSDTGLMYHIEKSYCILFERAPEMYAVKERNTAVNLLPTEQEE